MNSLSYFSPTNLGWYSVHCNLTVNMGCRLNECHSELQGSHRQNSAYAATITTGIILQTKPIFESPAMEHKDCIEKSIDLRLRRISTA